MHPAWLPPDAFRALGSRRVLVQGTGLLVDTVREEVVRAGGQLVPDGAGLVLALSIVDSLPAALRAKANWPT